MKRAIETKDQINGVKTDEMMTILPHMYEVTRAVSSGISAAIAAKVMDTVFKALEDDFDMMIKTIKTLTKSNKQ